jgi:hypothetical protein
LVSRKEEDEEDFFFSLVELHITITNKQINVHVEKLSPKNATKQVCWKTHHKSTTKHIC